MEKIWKDCVPGENYIQLNINNEYRGIFLSKISPTFPEI